MDSQQSGSGLASVVRFPQRLTLWPLLENGDPFAQFHAKFWATDMKDEERTWRGSQSSTGIGANEGQDHDEGMDLDLDEVSGVSERMNDEETTSGCYSLDIDIEGFEISTLWIIPDYIKIYGGIKKHYNDCARRPGRAPSAVVTGQPGIGKSVWIYYALRRRLAEREPAIWYRGGKCYLFVEEGVYLMPVDFEHTLFKTIVWTFVDSDGAVDGPPKHLVCQGTRLYVIYVTSPVKERWSRLHKTTRNAVVIMNPWTRKDIFRAASTMPPGTIDYSLVDEALDTLGGTPRICVELVSTPRGLEDYQKEVKVAILNTTSDQLRKWITDSTSLDMDSVSHKICLISRKSLDNVHSEAVVAPLTPSIQSRLANQFRKLGQDEQLRLYTLFTKVPEFSAMAGIFYEALARRHLQNGFVRRIIPMVKLDRTHGSKMSQWHTSHMLLSTPELEVLRQRASQHTVMINVLPTKTAAFTDDGPSSIKQGVLYLPKETNHEALDPFIWLGEFFYFFQFTIGPTHDGFKAGVLRFFEQYQSIPRRSHWRLVFIIPPNSTLKSPQPRRQDLREIAPFSAMVGARTD